MTTNHPVPTPPPSEPALSLRPVEGRCGFTLIGRDGWEQPCDRPATGWRWYQDCDHEDTLDVACDRHENEGGRRLRAAEETLDVGALAAEQSAMISCSYPADLSGEAHLWRRCAKAGEEHGEVIEALLGLVGENPRKGVTADREKVIKELLDEAFAALGAVEHLRGNDGSSGRLLAEHAVFVTTRLRAALAEGASR